MMTVSLKSRKNTQLEPGSAAPAMFCRTYPDRRFPAIIDR